MSRLPLILVLMLALIAGCRPDRSATPLATEGSRELLSTTTPIRLDGVLVFESLPDLTQRRHAEKWITAADGGVVELNGFQVVIPPGALPTDALITIDLPTDLHLAKRVMAEFGPHGMQFNHPVTLVFPLEGVRLPVNREIEVARWESNAWVSLGGVVSPDGKWLSSTTPHFSRYSGHVMAGG